MRYAWVDQTKTLSLTSIEESTLYIGQRLTAGCFLSPALLKVLLQTSDRVSTKRIRPRAGIQHCRGERMERVDSIPLQAP